MVLDCSVVGTCLRRARRISSYFLLLEYITRSYSAELAHRAHLTTLTLPPSFRAARPRDAVNMTTTNLRTRLKR
jgi:hypothetical protein